MKYTAHKQSGLAIVTVLLMIALMVTLLGFLLEQQHLLMRRLGNQNIAEQGFQYATGVDEWAMRLLHDDPDRTIDYLDEDWAKFGDPPEEVADGENPSFTLDNTRQQEEEPLPEIDFGIDGLSYAIIDLQSRFNLNNLANENDDVRRGQEVIFFNLLSILEVGDLAEREELLGALIDWLDKGSIPSANGFESPDYQSQNTPYYAADQKLSSLGELRYVRGFTKEVINQLEPFVTVLPIDNSRLNINTTSTEVMTAVTGQRAELLDTSSVQVFLSQREEEGFQGFPPAQIQAAQSAIIGSLPFEGGFIKNMLQTSSQFFQIITRVELGDFKYCSHSTVFRQNAQPGANGTPKVSVLNRYYNTICDEIVR